MLPWLNAFAHKDYEQALVAAYKFNMPTFMWDPLLRAATLGKLGRFDEASAARHELQNLCPDFENQAEFYVRCYVHDDEIHSDVIDGLAVAENVSS